MPRVGFDLMIPVLERAKMVHALDLAATLIGSLYCFHAGHFVESRCVYRSQRAVALTLSWCYLFTFFVS
jgi:hypothetical protein